MLLRLDAEQFGCRFAQHRPALVVGEAWRVWVSKAWCIAARCLGEVPQQPPMMRAPAS